MADKPLSVKDDTFQTEVLESPLPVLVDFWAPWCGPCRAVGPILEQLAEDYAGRVKVVKVNVDEEQRTAGQMGVRSIPTLALFKGGNLVQTLVGLRPKEQIAQAIDAVLGVKS